MRIYFLILCLLLHWGSIAQTHTGEQDVIQLSGLVVNDSMQGPVQFASISVKNTKRGTNTDFMGFFSLVIRKSEQVQVSALGYKKTYIKIPDTLSQTHYAVIVQMIRDTIMLREAIVHPWPSEEQFKKAFVELKLPMDPLDIAKKNLESIQMKSIFLRYGMDAGGNYNQYVRQQSDKLYYAGQMAPNPLLNPLSWAAFFKALFNGDLSEKNQK